MHKKIIITVVVACFSLLGIAQDTTTYKLRLHIPILDVPENVNGAYAVPSMQQSFEISNDLYELGFWGIEALGNKLFTEGKADYPAWKSITHKTFNYGLGILFSRYASELPIPLGVWGHEEFHRSTLGIADVDSKNGNWFPNRWDGTVYGISDSTLNNLKQNDLNQLLYSYTAGVQYEIYSNQINSTRDFFYYRSEAKNALLLYNAYYVFDYFKFSASDISDSVKVIAPEYEDPDPRERDYAGADLTAWIYDMFNPDLPFTSRDPFPNGEGVNRRVGFSDLSPEAQQYLEDQKQLALLNFINPAIIFINRIPVNVNLSFNFFVQYSPTHFGNDIAFFLPVQYKQFDILAQVHNYNNYQEKGWGAGIGLYNYQLTKKLESDIAIHMWDQPAAFFENKKTFGGIAEITGRYAIQNQLSASLTFSYKTNGWIIGNPNLANTFNTRIGIQYNIAQ